MCEDADRMECILFIGLLFVKRPNGFSLQREVLASNDSGLLAASLGIWVQMTVGGI